MRNRIIPLLSTLFLSISIAVAGAQDCPALVEKAMSRAERACAGLRGNQACYGYQSLEATLAEGLSSFAFNGVGDITGVDTIRSLRLSALDPLNDIWGVSVMRVRADISTAFPNENVTLLAFGDVSLNPSQSADVQPMQAFAFRSGDAASGCTGLTENGLLIQTPEGVGRITLWINDVRVRIGSTVLFQAQPDGDMTVSTFEGLAQVEAHGQMQEAPAGMQVRVPLDADMQPIAPPTPPEPFDAQVVGMLSLVDLVTDFTDGSARQLFGTGSAGGGGAVEDGSAGNGGGADSGDGNSDESSVDSYQNCNHGNGQGDDNGNCFGHDNPNNPHNPNNSGGGNNGNGNGNGGGNGSNGGGNGNGNNGNGNGNGGGNGSNGGGNGNGNGG